VLIAGLSLRRAALNQRSLTAATSWHVYLKLAFDNPILSYPPKFINRFDFDNKSIEDKDGQRNAELFEQYEWFVSILFVTARDIFLHNPNDIYWKVTIERNIRYHSEFIRWRRSNNNSLTDFLRNAGPEVEKIIARIIVESPTQRG
jgi:hypothetical protein